MDGQVPAEEIPVLYQDIINSETAAMADKELHSQMVAWGHPNIGFAHRTPVSLHNGSILWHGRDKPSNLSFFTLYKNNPLLEAQTSPYLSLNILANNVDNKNIKEIKASQKIRNAIRHCPPSPTSLQRNQLKPPLSTKRPHPDQSNDHP
jgi:hypothetical protein